MKMCIDMPDVWRGACVQLGAGPNRLVALVMEKGWEQVVGAIAVLEAGGAYLPVDPDLPQEQTLVSLAPRSRWRSS